MTWRRERRTLTIAILLCVLTSAAAATDSDNLTSDRLGLIGADYDTLLVGSTIGPEGTLTRSLLLRTMAVKDRGRNRMKVNRDALYFNFNSFLRDSGLATRPFNRRSGRGIGGLSFSFGPTSGLPPVLFSFGEESPDHFTAFASPREDYSWSIIVPVRQFQFTIRSGDDRQFGYYAIGGLQWTALDGNVSLGIGVPYRMRHSSNEIGVLTIVRIRIP